MKMQKQRPRRAVKMTIQNVDNCVRLFNALKPKITVRHVKFTPEEMAYDAPEETNPKDWVFVGRGPLAIGAKPSDARAVRLDPDVSRYFDSDALVNETLRRAMWLMQVQRVMDGTENSPMRRKKQRRSRRNA